MRAGFDCIKVSRAGPCQQEAVASGSRLGFRVKGLGFRGVPYCLKPPSGGGAFC